jgi:hypothetical protein
MAAIKDSNQSGLLFFMELEKARNQHYGDDSDDDHRANGQKKRYFVLRNVL